MKIINAFCSATALFASLVMGSAAQAAPITYDFKYTFVDGTAPGAMHTIMGSFTGVASGNLITDIADVTASINGLGAPSPLFADSFDSNTKQVITTGAVVSFDGLASNFIFTTNATDLSQASYFYVIPWANPGETTGSATIGTQAVWPGIGVIDAYNGQYRVANWSISAAAVNTDVPEPASSALFGIALLGLGIAARKRGSKG